MVRSRGLDVSHPDFIVYWTDEMCILAVAVSVVAGAFPLLLTMCFKGTSHRAPYRHRAVQVQPFVSDCYLESAQNG